MISRAPFMPDRGFLTSWASPAASSPKAARCSAFSIRWL